MHAKDIFKTFGNQDESEIYLAKLHDKEKCDYYSTTFWNNNTDLEYNYEELGYCTRWIEVMDLKEGMEIAVPYNPSSLTKSEVKNIFTLPCFFNALSSDQIPQAYLSAAAKYCTSSGSGLNEFASSRNGLSSSEGITSILSSATDKNLSKSLDDLCVLANIESLCLANSEITNSGVINSILSETSISAALLSLIRAENNSLASKTNSIHTSSLYFLDTSLFTFLPSSKASCSVNSLSDPKNFKKDNCLAFLDIAALATLDQSTLLNLSITSLTSFGTDTDTFTISSSPINNYETAYLNIAEKGVEFEKISSIEVLEKQQVYDLAIDGTHNFIANDIIAHNTNRYLQYLAKFNTSNASLTPKLLNVTLNYTGLFTDSRGNYNFSFIAPSGGGTYPIKVNATFDNIPGENSVNLVVDTSNPTIKSALNKSTNILQSDIINATFNATDDGLSTGQVIVNDTGIKRYFNFTLSGTSMEFSQNFTVSCPEFCVVNVTGLVNDTVGNKFQNETIFTVTRIFTPTNIQLEDASQLVISGNSQIVIYS